MLLDLGLPDIDGSDVCRQLRQRSRVPIIVVTARGDEIDRVILLELGADDYVVKPFGFRELVARIRAVLRRTGEQNDAGAPTRASTSDGSHIDTRTRSVTFDGDPVALTPKEHDLLVYLARDPGAVLTREQLIEDVWDENWWGSTKTLDVHVASLRKKLVPGAHRDGARRGVPPRRGDRRAVTRRLLLGYLLAAVVVLLVLEIPLAIFYQQREMERLERDVERDATVLAGYYEDALEARAARSIRRRRERLRAAHRRPRRRRRQGRHVGGRHRRARRPRLLDPPRDRDRAARRYAPSAPGTPTR